MGAAALHEHQQEEAGAVVGRVVFLVVQRLRSVEGRSELLIPLSPSTVGRKKDFFDVIWEQLAIGRRDEQRRVSAAGSGFALDGGLPRDCAQGSLGLNDYLRLQPQRTPPNEVPTSSL